MAKFESIHPGGASSSAAKSQHDLRNQAREHARDALGLVIKVLGNPRATPQARIAAARTLLERGWGDSLQEEVRPHRQAALDTLVGIMNHAGTSLRTRLAAADALLDFGGGEARARVIPTLPAPDRQQWLDELKEIREQFTVGRPTMDRPETRN